MKAIVFHEPGDVRLDEVKEPRIQDSTDAVVRLTGSAICGTDLHMIRGTMPGMKKGTVLGHEGVGVVVKTGRDVRNFREGDRVVVPSTIACGYCSYCRAGYHSQCDETNPNGRRAGTAFYGGPASSGPFAGMQAEQVRVPYAAVNLVKIPDEVADDEAILVSDILPTGWFGAELAEVGNGDTVAVFGCGPVGLCSILSARLLGASRIFAVDHHPDRLDMARDLGAEVVNFEKENPVEALLELTGGIGPDRAIDAVGIDAESAHRGPAARGAPRERFEKEVEDATEGHHPVEGRFVPGDAPSQVVDWAVESLAKAGTLSIIGVYPETCRSFPLGAAMNRNLTVKMGNCPHRRYVPMLLDLIRAGEIDPAFVITETCPLTEAVDAYRRFDERAAGWVKVMLEPVPA